MYIAQDRPGTPDQITVILLINVHIHANCPLPLHSSSIPLQTCLNATEYLFILAWS